MWWLLRSSPPRGRTRAPDTGAVSRRSGPAIPPGLRLRSSARRLRPLLLSLRVVLRTPGVACTRAALWAGAAALGAGAGAALLASCGPAQPLGPADLSPAPAASAPDPHGGAPHGGDLHGGDLHGGDAPAGRTPPSVPPPRASRPVPPARTAPLGHDTTAVRVRKPKNVYRAPR